MDSVLKELVVALREEEGIEASPEELAEYGAHIHRICPTIAAEAALFACIDDEDCWASLVEWIGDPNRKKAGGVTGITQ